MKIQSTSIALALLASSSAASAANVDVLEIDHRPEFVEFTNVQFSKPSSEARVELLNADAKGNAVRSTTEFVEHAFVTGKRPRDEVHQEVLRTVKRDQ